jgi:hypothetical protein
MSKVNLASNVDKIFIKTDYILCFLVCVRTFTLVHDAMSLCFSLTNVRLTRYIKLRDLIAKLRMHPDMASLFISCLLKLSIISPVTN